MFKKGFTLIELLIVIAIIAILAGVVFVSLDPTKRFLDARNASRWTDVTAILSAIKVNQVDLGGSYTSTINALTVGNNNYILGTAASGCDAGCSVTTQATCLDIGALVTGGYLGKMPVSPKGSGDTDWSTTKTGYYLSKNTNGSITVAACSAEASPTVTVTR